MIILNKYPLPPTSNQMYTSMHGRLIKSPLAREYVRKTEIYALKNQKIINVIKESFLGKGPLAVDFYFVFPLSKVFSKKNEYKMLDGLNRTKQASDTLAKMIGIDDKMFVSSKVVKVVASNDTEEHAIITINQAKQITYDTIFDMIRHDK